MTRTDNTDFDAAIALWKSAAARERRANNHKAAEVYDNAARELEIERDTGKIVRLNPRIR